MDARIETMKIKRTTCPLRKTKCKGKRPRETKMQA